MGLQGFEKRLERLVEGVFTRAFRAALRPVEVGRRIVREMDLSSTLGVRGERVAPNEFAVHLAPSDLERFESFHDDLLRELHQAVDEHAAEHGYQLKGPTTVALVADPACHTGQVTVRSAIRPGPRPTGPIAWLTLHGQRVGLSDADPVTIGRLPDCDVVLADPNVSRRHAEVRVHDGDVVVVDLGSLNGTRVNGRGVGTSGQRLADGDEIQIGSSVIHYALARPGG